MVSSIHCSLRNKIFHLVSDQRKTEERDFWFWPRDNERRSIFRAVFGSLSSFFSPKPHGNACYAGYIHSYMIKFWLNDKRYNDVTFSLVINSVSFFLSEEAFFWPINTWAFVFPWRSKVSSYIFNSFLLLLPIIRLILLDPWSRY